MSYLMQNMVRLEQLRENSSRQMLRLSVLQRLLKLNDIAQGSHSSNLPNESEQKRLTYLA